MLNEQTYSLYLSGKLTEQDLLEDIDPQVLEKIKQYANDPSIKDKKFHHVKRELAAILEFDKEVALDANNLLYKHFKNKVRPAMKDIKDIAADEAVPKFIGKGMMGVSGWVRRLMSNFGTTMVVNTATLPETAQALFPGKKYVIVLNKEISKLIAKEAETTGSIAETTMSAFLHELGHVIDHSKEEKLKGLFARFKQSYVGLRATRLISPSGQEERAWSEAEKLMTDPHLKHITIKIKKVCLGSYADYASHVKTLGAKAAAVLLITALSVLGLKKLANKLHKHTKYEPV